MMGDLKKLSKKYRKRPLVIEAVQYTGHNEAELSEFMGGIRIHPTLRFPVINTPEGDHLVGTNDYVIKGIKGEFYPCKADIFELTYEEV